MPIGTDIVRISRMQSLLRNDIPPLVFCPDEKKYILSKKDKYQTAAGIFAAKEAILKAMGTGITVPLSEVCIDHTKGGVPGVVLKGKAREKALSLGFSDFEVSITHDGDYAIASAVCQLDTRLKYYNMAISKLDNAPDNVISKELIQNILPKRKSDTHKGSYGRVYALAGSKGMTGAAILSCSALLYCGAGLITLGCANELNPIFEISLKEVMTKPLKDKNGIICGSNADSIIKEIKKSDIALVGPGLGRTSGIDAIVKEIILNDNCPCVIDADGLNAISKSMTSLKNHKSPLILTPHIGEFERLSGIKAEKILKDKAKYASEFASKYNVTLILKSHETVVATPCGTCFVNRLGNPGMATGGTGDVLAGTVASFAAQGIEFNKAALAGVYIHSLGADMAAYEKGEYSLTPTDILEYLPYAIKYSQNF